MKTRIILLGISALVSAQVARAQITTNLVAYYDFEDLANDPAASGPALTASGTGHTLGVSGGKVGNAVEFTGTTNNFLNTAIGFGGGGSNQLGNSFTVSAWYNLDTDATSAASRFFVFEGATDYDISYGIRDLLNANGFNDTQTFTNGVGSSNFVDVHTPGTWQHVLMTYQSVSGTTTITTYIDGVAMGTPLSGPTTSLVSGGIHIGNARNGNLTRVFDGKIDEFAAWSRVLASGEIASVYNAGVNGQRINEIAGFTVSVNSAAPLQGVATGSGFYSSGTEVPVSVVPSPGYVFSEWTGGFAGQPESFTHTVVANVTSTAVFGQDLSDPDDDDLTTYEEIVIYGTDPNDADSDGDLIPDGVEIASFLDPNVDDSALVAFVNSTLCPDNAGAIAMSDVSITRDSGSGELSLKMSFLGSLDQTTWTPIVLSGPSFSITPVIDGWEVTLPAPSDTVDSYILLGKKP